MFERGGSCEANAKRMNDEGHGFEVAQSRSPACGL
jgi:hypothetical protein